ncbi:hypothetical protein DIPPA_14415 [Diplonema papillatum]|nr:hypothetical protein DIPPA_14415 [Diplonema papillatum]
MPTKPSPSRAQDLVAETSEPPVREGGSPMPQVMPASPCSLASSEQMTCGRADMRFLGFPTPNTDADDATSDNELIMGNQSCTDDERTIDRLEGELLEYKDGMETARQALEAAVDEKRMLEDRLRSTEAVFNERKRNFDHIITIFGEEKKTIVDSKAELEAEVGRLQTLLAEANERNALSQPADPTVEPGPSAEQLAALHSRIEELETMLGQSGLARQELEDKLASAQTSNAELKEKLDSMERIQEEARRALESSVRQKEEECSLKEKEINDLKTYVGKKAIQWEQYKDESVSAKKRLEQKFEERCRELDDLQKKMEAHKEYSEGLQKKNKESEAEIARLNRGVKELREDGEGKNKDRDGTERGRDAGAADATVASGSSAGFTTPELMSLLEEKERVIEHLTQKPTEAPARAPSVSAGAANGDKTEMKRMSEEVARLTNSNKSLADEVLGLKSLVFKLEHKSYAKPSSQLAFSHQQAGAADIPRPTVETFAGRAAAPQPAHSGTFTRSHSGAKAGGGLLRFPSPGRRSAGYSTLVGARDAVVAARSKGHRTVSPMGSRHTHTASPSARAASPGLSSRRGSAAGVAKMPTSSPMVLRHGRKHLSTFTPLTSRPLNCGDV